MALVVPVTLNLWDLTRQPRSWLSLILVEETGVYVHHQLNPFLDCDPKAEFAQKIAEAVTVYQFDWRGTVAASLILSVFREGSRSDEKSLFAPPGHGSPKIGARWKFGHDVSSGARVRMRARDEDGLPFALPLPVGVDSLLPANPVATPTPVPRYLGTGPPIGHPKRGRRHFAARLLADGSGRRRVHL